MGMREWDDSVGGEWEESGEVSVWKRVGGGEWVEENLGRGEEGLWEESVL